MAICKEYFNKENSEMIRLIEISFYKIFNPFEISHILQKRHNLITIQTLDVIINLFI